MKRGWIPYELPLISRGTDDGTVCMAASGSPGISRSHSHTQCPRPGAQPGPRSPAGAPEPSWGPDTAVPLGFLSGDAKVQQESHTPNGNFYFFLKCGCVVFSFFVRAYCGGSISFIWLFFQIYADSSTESVYLGWTEFVLLMSGSKTEATQKLV